MAKRIYLIGGSKGGVDKSLVTMATVDYLQECGESVLLIESDTNNPDGVESLPGPHRNGAGESR